MCVSSVWLTEQAAFDLQPSLIYNFKTLIFFICLAYIAIFLTNFMEIFMHASFAKITEHLFIKC